MREAVSGQVGVLQAYPLAIGEQHPLQLHYLVAGGYFQRGGQLGAWVDVVPGDQQAAGLAPHQQRPLSIRFQ